MQRPIVCADGTWNSRDAADPTGKGLTNVARLERGIAPADARGVRQTTYYHTGVGVGPWWDRMLGGAFGQGLSKNIQSCYEWLAEHFEPGDEIYLFGFSRGAYTARSLGGLIRNCGVLRREHVGRAAEAYDFYRDRRDDTHPASAKAQAFRRQYSHETPIKCIGVWDTVGALGVPTRGPVGMFTRHKYGFHDVTLSSQVENAFHALAIDERRKPFAPTLWEVAERNPAQRVEQVWFAGVHSNVGGGYEDCKLSDLALRWMYEKARGCGLAFKDDFEATLSGACEGKLYDSMSTAFKLMGSYTRPVCAPRVGADKRPVYTFESVHESVHQRRTTCAAPPVGPYDPPNLRAYLAQHGAAAT